MRLNVPHRFLTVLALGLLTFLPSDRAHAGTVTAVGSNLYGQATAPTASTNTTSVTAGRDFSLALNADGTVAGWGLNGEGRSTPPANLTGVIALSAGTYHTLALQADGTVLGWGFNGNDILAVPPTLPTSWPSPPGATTAWPFAAMVRWWVGAFAATDAPPRRRPSQMSSPLMPAGISAWL